VSPGWPWRSRNQPRKAATVSLRSGVQRSFFAPLAETADVNTGAERDILNAQSEGLLEFESHPHMQIADLLQVRFGHRPFLC
jgi:hypothetical protein